VPKAGFGKYFDKILKRWVMQGPPANRAIWQWHFSIFSLSREGK